MKKKSTIMAISLVLCSSISFQSCIGSFSLTNKVLTWNHQVSNKFVNELVFFAFWVLPVYEVTAIADLLVINSIEFWSGNKPLEATNRTFDTDHGQYFIASDENGYIITSPNGDILNFSYDSQENMWSFSKNNSEKINFMKFEDNNHLKMLDASGDFVDIELTDEGVGNFISVNLFPSFAMN